MSEHIVHGTGSSLQFTYTHMHMNIVCCWVSLFKVQSPHLCNGWWDLRYQRETGFLFCFDKYYEICYEISVENGYHNEVLLGPLSSCLYINMFYKNYHNKLGNVLNKILLKYHFNIIEMVKILNSINKGENFTLNWFY